MKNKTSWKAFNISMPDKLIPIYDFLQSELNFFISNYKSQLDNINLSKHRGDIWRDIRDIPEIKERVSKWTLHNKAWHSYIVFENIRRELESKKTNRLVFDVLSKHEFKITSELREELVSLNLYPTNAQLRNMIQSGKPLQLPDETTFNLDYTVSSKQFFKMDNHGLCSIQVSKKEWIDYQIMLPLSIDRRFTGKIAKPRFIKRKSDNRYIGLCSYEYQIYDRLVEDNILGVDLGQIKLYSAVVLFKDGSHSDEYIHSKRLQSQKEKINRLINEYSILYHKKRAYEKLNYKSDKVDRVIENYYRVKKKRTRMKSHQSRMIANEIVELALSYNCKEIHLENLSWLGSQAGKWNFSDVQSKIEEKALSYGIRVVKVSAYRTSRVHPITGEIGELEGRMLKFGDYVELDRDFVAALNIAQRHKVESKKIEVKKIEQVKTVRVLTKSRRREISEEYKKLKGNTEIVVFLPNVADGAEVKLAVCPIYSVLSQNVSLCTRYKKVTVLSNNYTINTK